jgi:ubiquinol-cytochrome c reductase cytochrome b subunit
MSLRALEKVFQEKTEFSNPVIRWIDYRLPIFTFLHHELTMKTTAAPRSI